MQAVDVIHVLLQQEVKLLESMNWFYKFKHKKRIEYIKDYLLKTVEEICANDLIKKESKLATLYEKISEELNEICLMKRITTSISSGSSKKNLSDEMRLSVMSNEKEFEMKLKILNYWLAILKTLL